MIILDTNVISEAVRVKRDPGVIAWLNEQTSETLYLTSISLSEILLGIEILPSGKRKDNLSGDLDSLISKLFGSRILPFDRDSAKAYGTLVRRARLAGKSTSMADGQIAAIAHVHNFSVATRDNLPFDALGVPVINPWRVAERT